MTPSTSATLEGFLQGLYAQTLSIAIVGALLASALIFLRWVIGKMVTSKSINDGDALVAYRCLHLTVLSVGIFALISFLVSAANYATNLIPHSTLDSSAINADIESNIKR